MVNQPYFFVFRLLYCFKQYICLYVILLPGCYWKLVYSGFWLHLCNSFSQMYLAVQYL